MFTGLVETVGRVVSREGARLVVSYEGIWGDDPVQVGESVAVNGVCLTALGEGGPISFDVSEETFAKTSLGGLAVGSSVNLERSLRPSDRMGGHFVQGHVDTTGVLESVEELEGSWRVVVSVGREWAKYLVPKGSVCMDGISLTVVDPTDSGFEVAVIPHTWAHTSLSSLAVGSTVNLEFDTLVKTIERLLAFRD